MLLQFEHLHLNNLIALPAKQNPQNLHDLHCFNKDNDTLRELPPWRQTAVVSPEQTAQGRSCPMCRKGPPQLQGHSCWRPGAREPPASQHICPGVQPAALPAGESCATGFHTIEPFQFWILHLQWSVVGLRPVSSSTQLLLCTAHPCRPFFQKLSPPTLDLVCSSSKKCSSSNILIVTSQPTLTLLVHSETTLFQGFSYHTTGESFQEASCTKVN